MTIFIIIIVWIISVPIGYLTIRWSSRIEDSSWTHNDQLLVIFFSLITGPVSIIIGLVATFVIWLSTSDWGNRDARW